MKSLSKGSISFKKEGGNTKKIGNISQSKSTIMIGQRDSEAGEVDKGEGTP